MENVEVIVQEQDQKKSWFGRFNKKAVTGAILSSAIISSSAMANVVDLGIDAEGLKTLILGLIATIALLGTAYLTVLVAVSAFSLIRRVVRG